MLIPIILLGFTVSLVTPVTALIQRKVLISRTIRNFRVFGTVRLSQLSKEFLRSEVSSNVFIKGNEKCEKMIDQTIKMISNELTDRNVLTASTRHQNQINVLPTRNDAKKQIAR